MLLPDFAMSQIKQCFPLIVLNKKQTCDRIQLREFSGQLNFLPAENYFIAMPIPVIMIAKLAARDVHLVDS